MAEIYTFDKDKKKNKKKGGLKKMKYLSECRDIWNHFKR